MSVVKYLLFNEVHLQLPNTMSGAPGCLAIVRLRAIQGVKKNTRAN